MDETVDVIQKEKLEEIRASIRARAERMTQRVAQAARDLDRTVLDRWPQWQMPADPTPADSPE